MSRKTGKSLFLSGALRCLLSASLAILSIPSAANAAATRAVTSDVVPHPIVALALGMDPSQFIQPSVGELSILRPLAMAGAPPALEVPQVSVASIIERQAPILAVLAHPELIAEHRASLTEHFGPEKYVALRRMARLASMDKNVQPQLARIRSELADSSADLPEAELRERLGALFDQTLRGHTVLISDDPADDQVARRLLGSKELFRKGGVVLITPKIGPRKLRAYERRGIRVILAPGNEDKEELLREAGIGTAKKVISTLEDDGRAFDWAAAARGLNKNIRIVCNVMDAAFGKLMETRGIVDVAIHGTLRAARFFTSLSLGERTYTTFDHEGRIYTLGQLTAETLGGLNGKTMSEIAAATGLAPVAILVGSRDDEEVKFNFGPEAILQHDERLVVVGPTDRWQTLLGHSPVAMGRWRKIWNYLLHAIDTVPYRVKVATGLTAAFMTAASIYFSWSMDLDLFKAFYFVNTIVTSTGLGDIVPKTFQQMLVTTMLMEFGIFMHGTLLAILGTIFLGLGDSIRSLAKIKVRYNNHVIVYGSGEIVDEIVRLLHEMGQLVAVITEDLNSLSEHIRWHVPVVVGNPTRNETLLRAGIRRARQFIVVSPQGARNLHAFATASTLNPAVSPVIRIDDADRARDLRARFTSPLRAYSWMGVLAARLWAAAAYAGALTGVILRGRLFVSFEAGTEGSSAQGDMRPVMVTNDNGQPMPAILMPDGKPSLMMRINSP